MPAAAATSMYTSWTMACLATLSSRPILAGGLSKAATKKSSGAPPALNILDKNRLAGRDSIFSFATRDKTSNPNLNIENYQDWGPLGGLAEAVNLLRGLPGK